MHWYNKGHLLGLQNQIGSNLHIKRYWRFGFSIVYLVLQYKCTLFVFFEYLLRLPRHCDFGRYNRNQFGNNHFHKAKIKCCKSKCKIGCQS
uniref:Uncharacterized protein n=1 Tax=Romanomermis culicivorax TaxID=13658 RepID=A0A915I1X7_ROMCU